MSRERDIAKNSFIFTAGRIAAQFIAFLLLPLYSALLTPEDYGIADLLNTTVFLIIPFIGVQLDTALFRFTVDSRNDDKKQKTLFSTVIIVNIVQCLAFIAIYMAVRPVINLQYKDYILFNVILLILSNTFLQFMRGLGMNVRYSTAVFITSFSSLLINVILVAGFRWGVVGIIVGSTASQALTLLYSIIVVKPWKHFKIREYNKETAHSLFKYSLPLVPNTLAWWVMGISDRLVISSAVGISANGIYSLANKFSSIYTSVTDSINLSWVESTSLHFKDKDSKEYMSGMLNTLFTLFASGCFMFIAVIPYAFLVINKDYSDSYMQIPILLLAALCQAAVGIISSVLIATKNTKSIAVTSVIAAIVNLVIDIVLVNKIGIYAGSISTLAAFLALAILRCIAVKKTFNVSMSLKVLIPVTVWGAAVTFCYYLRNPYINILSVLITAAIAIIANRKIFGLLIQFIKNRSYSVKHKARINKIYGQMEVTDENSSGDYSDSLVLDDLNGQLTYKDESWNYIKDIRTYQQYLNKGERPDWEDNECVSDKFVYDGSTISVNAVAREDNWLCFYIEEQLPESYELSYDICIHSEFTEIQTAFNYRDLGNRYRFMIKNNLVCVFEAVYEGDFLDSFTEVPFSLSVGSTHHISIKVSGNLYEMYIDDVRILAVKENGTRSIDGNRACIILWNEHDDAGIECEISDIRLRYSR